jgi:hypothetical protein
MGCAICAVPNWRRRYAAIGKSWRSFGHLSEKQVQRYVEQASRRRMAHDAQRMRDEMYERQAVEKAIEAAPNVTRIA